MTFQNSFYKISIHIYNSMLALFQKHTLAMEIIIKIFMFIRSNMVRFNICKNTIVKCKAWNSVKHKSLWWNFHNNTFTSLLNHFCKSFLNNIRFRSCILCRSNFVTYYCFNSSNKSCLNANTFKHWTNHICSCCFSFSSCNTNSNKFLCRISKIISWHARKRKSCIFNLDNCYIFLNFHIIHNDNCYCSFRNNITYKFVSVKTCTFNADKNITITYFSWIIL